MRIAILLPLLLLISLTASGQDTLFIKNRPHIAVKILSAGVDTIRYKRYDNLNGPDYVIGSRSVEKIIYENGEVQTDFTSFRIKAQKPPRPPKTYH